MKEIIELPFWYQADFLKKRHRKSKLYNVQGNTPVEIESIDIEQAPLVLLNIEKYQNNISKVTPYREINGEIYTPLSYRKHYLKHKEEKYQEAFSSKKILNEDDIFQVSNELNLSGQLYMFNNISPDIIKHMVENSNDNLYVKSLYHTFFGKNYDKKYEVWNNEDNNNIKLIHSTNMEERKLDFLKNFGKMFIIDDIIYVKNRLPVFKIQAPFEDEQYVSSISLSHNEKLSFASCILPINMLSILNPIMEKFYNLASDHDLVQSEPNNNSECLYVNNELYEKHVGIQSLKERISACLYVSTKEQDYIDQIMQWENSPDTDFEEIQDIIFYMKNDSPNSKHIQIAQILFEEVNYYLKNKEQKNILIDENIENIDFNFIAQTAMKI